MQIHRLEVFIVWNIPRLYKFRFCYFGLVRARLAFGVEVDAVRGQAVRELEGVYRTVIHNDDLSVFNVIFQVCLRWADASA